MRTRGEWQRQACPRRGQTHRHRGHRSHRLTCQTAAPTATLNCTGMDSGCIQLGGASLSIRAYLGWFNEAGRVKKGNARALLIVIVMPFAGAKQREQIQLPLGKDWGKMRNGKNLLLLRENRADSAFLGISLASVFLRPSLSPSPQPHTQQQLSRLGGFLRTLMSNIIWRYRRRLFSFLPKIIHQRCNKKRVPTWPPLSAGESRVGGLIPLFSRVSFSFCLSPACFLFRYLGLAGY